MFDRKVAAGITVDRIIEDFPQLSAEDVHEALLYAAAVAELGMCGAQDQ